MALIPDITAFGRANATAERMRLERMGAAQALEAAKANAAARGEMIHRGAASEAWRQLPPALRRRFPGDGGNGLDAAAREDMGNAGATPTRPEGSAAGGRLAAALNFENIERNILMLGADGDGCP